MLKSLCFLYFHYIFIYEFRVNTISRADQKVGLWVYRVRNHTVEETCQVGVAFSASHLMMVTDNYSQTSIRKIKSHG